MRCCRPKKFGRLPEGLPHHHLSLAPTLPNPHYPSPRTKLASLVKGRWIDGKTQTVALLRFACDTSAFFIHQTFRRQDGGIATPLLPKPHYPSPRTTTLASLVKGEVLSPERIRATTGGIAFLPHPFRFSDTSVNNPSIVGSASHCNRSSPLHKGAKGDGALPTIPKPHYPSPCTTTLASLVKGEVLSPEKIRATTRGIAFLPHPFRFSDTSVNNPSVTVTENTILCQRIFNFYKKQC